MTRLPSEGHDDSYSSLLSPPKHLSRLRGLNALGESDWMTQTNTATCFAQGLVETLCTGTSEPSPFTGDVDEEDDLEAGNLPKASMEQRSDLGLQLALNPLRLLGPFSSGLLRSFRLFP